MSSKEREVKRDIMIPFLSLSPSIRTVIVKVAISLPKVKVEDENHDQYQYHYDTIFIIIDICKQLIRKKKMKDKKHGAFHILSCCPFVIW